MARQKTGLTVTKNGKLYARVQFVDESGRKRDLWRTASSKKDAKEKMTFIYGLVQLLIVALV
jgi:hypothetical protein